MSTGITYVLKNMKWHQVHVGTFHTLCFSGLLIKCKSDPKSKPPFPTRDALTNKLDPGDGHQSDAELEACRWSAEHSPKTLQGSR